MSDIFTIWEARGSLDDLKITYIGDGNNIVHSWLHLAQKFPMEFVCVCPENFEPDSNTVNNLSSAGISAVSISHDPEISVKNTDVIYTDVWASMGQKDEADMREKIFQPFQVNEDLMAATGKNTLFMHCLPAERGREVTDEVIEADYSIVFEQAENRLHVQNAICLLYTSPSPRD